MQPFRSIAIFDVCLVGFEKIYLESLIKVLGSHRDLEFEMYSNHLTSEQLDSLEYYGRANDPRIYEGFLDWIAEGGFSIGLITRLKHPEYLSNELVSRDDLGEASLVLIIFGYELFSKSRARAMCLKNLIEREEVKTVLQHSIAATQAVENHSHVMAEFRSGKWKTLFEPSYHEPSIEFKEPPGFVEFAQECDSILLFLGNFFYGKGVDLALDSFLNLESKNIGLVIVGQSSTVNFEFTKYTDIIRHHRRIYHLDRAASDSEMAYLLESAEVLLLPYRSTYAYGTSGLVLLGLQYGKKIIVPNIDPFTLLDYQRTCYFFDCEHPKSSLVSAIERAIADDLISRRVNPAATYDEILQTIIA